MVDRPLQHLHAADRPSDRRQRAPDTEVLEQPPVHRDEIAHGAEREAQSVGLAGARVDRARAGRALTAAQEVRADDVQAVGVERLAGPDEVVPPATPLRVAVMAGGVRVARERMADEHAVRPGRVELAVGLVRDLDEVQLLAGIEHERVALVPERDPLCLDQTERALDAPRYVDHAMP